MATKPGSVESSRPSINPAGLSNGTYTATILLKTGDSLQPLFVLPVELNITPRATWRQSHFANPENSGNAADTAKPGLLLRRNTDTDNVCFFDESAGLYRFYIRMWTGTDFTSKRVVGYLESKTFTGPLARTTMPA